MLTPFSNLSRSKVQYQYRLPLPPCNHYPKTLLFMPHHRALSSYHVIVSVRHEPSNAGDVDETVFASECLPSLLHPGTTSKLCVTGYGGNGASDGLCLTLTYSTHPLLINSESTIRRATASLISLLWLTIFPTLHTFLLTSERMDNNRETPTPPFWSPYYPKRPYGCLPATKTKKHRTCEVKRLPWACISS